MCTHGARMSIQWFLFTDTKFRGGGDLITTAVTYIICVHTGVIPKASTPDRVRENSKLSDFSISTEDMQALTSQFTGPHHFCWDPSDVA